MITKNWNKFIGESSIDKCVFIIDFYFLECLESVIKQSMAFLSSQDGDRTSDIYTKRTDHVPPPRLAYELLFQLPTNDARRERT